MSDNLLQNPGFEGGFYFQDDQGELKIADGWTGWFVDEGGIEPAWKNRRPEYNLVVESVRVRSGRQAQQYGIIWATHWAGLYQQVNGIVPGQRYRFSIWGYVFGLRADQNADHPGNLHLKVGIDPTGGVDPFGSSVVWGEEVNDYRAGIAYTEGSDAPWHLFSVETVAESDRITVFTHSRPEWPLKQLGSQWDDAELVAVEEEEPPEPEPPAVGLPRVQYERTYVLLPPGADKEWVNAVIEGCWDQKRYTIGGSADDAGIGALDVRRVIAVNPQEWE